MKSDNTTMNKLQSFVLFFVIMALPSFAWGQKKSVVSAQASAACFRALSSRRAYLHSEPYIHCRTFHHRREARYIPTGNYHQNRRHGPRFNRWTDRGSRQIEYHGGPRQYYRRARNGGERRSTRKTRRSNSRQRQPNASRQNRRPERRRSRRRPAQRPNPFR